MTKVCVTGASGFIAHHIVYHLLERGYQVIGTVRDVNKKTSYLKTLQEKFGSDNLQLIEADLLKEGSFDNAVKNCDYVIHTASPFFLALNKDISEEEYKRLLVEPALKGTENVLKAVLKHKDTIKHVVLTSSVAALTNCLVPGKQPLIVSDKDWNSLESFEEAGEAYCYSKTIAEKFAWEFCNEHHLSLTTVHPSMVIGPVLPYKTEEIIKKEKGNRSLIGTSEEWIASMVIGGGSSPILDTQMGIVNVTDVALTHILCMEKVEISKGNRFICSLVEKTGIEYCQELKKLYPELPVSSNFVYQFENVPKFKFDTSKTKELLGVKFIGVEQTLRESVDSMKELNLL
ncbi:hypothetical protein ABK040_000705 [Willaertia magna]